MTWYVIIEESRNNAHKTIYQWQLHSDLNKHEAIVPIKLKIMHAFQQITYICTTFTPQSKGKPVHIYRIWVIPCQINKEFWVASQILTKLGVFVVVCTCVCVCRQYSKIY